MKKGFTYTLFAITIIMSLIALTSLQSSYKYNLETSSKIRSNLVANSLNDARTDLTRSSYIATKRAMLSLVDYTVINGTFLNDSKQAIEIASIEGTYNNTELELMENNSVNDWTTSIHTILYEMGMESTVKLINFSTRQVDLYDVETTAIYELEIYDPISRIRIKRNTTVNTSAEYESFEDPLNTVKSNMIFSTSIILCNLTGGYGKILSTPTNATVWTVGRVFKATDTAGIASLSGVEREEKILVTKNVSKFSVSDINDFKGVISETPDDSAGITTDKIINATDAYNRTNNTYMAAMSTEIDQWINNILTGDGTTCFIEHGKAPTFFDRLEGNLSRGKYEGPGIATFIDPTVLPKNAQKELDYIYWGS